MEIKNSVAINWRFEGFLYHLKLPSILIWGIRPSNVIRL